MATKLGIIGDGNVGSALARGLERAGHEVRAVGKDKEAIRHRLVERGRSPRGSVWRDPEATLVVPGDEIDFIPLPE